MAKEFKQWKVSDMIEKLKYVKEQFGDLPVEISSDEEGNTFGVAGEIGEHSSVTIDADVPTKVIIYPFDWIHG